MENRTTKDLEITENGKSKEYKDYYNKDGDYYGLQLGDYEAKRQEVYSKAKWDFESIWAINKNVGYPYFKWQTAKPIVSSEVKEGATTINGKGEEDGIIFVKIAGKNILQLLQTKHGASRFLHCKKVIKLLFMPKRMGRCAPIAYISL